MSAYDQYYPQHVRLHPGRDEAGETSEKERLGAPDRGRRPCTFERIVLSLISELIGKGECATILPCQPPTPCSAC